MTDEPETPGTLKLGEFHPCAPIAMQFLRELGLPKLLKHQEALSSCAIEGNRLAEVCGETLQLILEGGKVSDRYLLGLAWQIMTMEMMCKDGNEDLIGKL